MNINNYIKEYLSEMKDIHQSLLEYVDCEEDDSFQLKSFYNQYENSKIEKNRDTFKEFLYLISYVANNHRSPKTIERISRIILHFKDQIKQTFSNIEIFKIFIKHQKVLLFLFKEDIIQPSQSISLLATTMNYDYYFYPELKSFYTESQRQKIEKVVNEIEDFEQKREIGENDSYICQLIRDDSVEDFIVYVNKRNLSKTSKIERSIFETNPFLVQKTPTLIQYSAFFGSIQIFRYLKYNNANLNDTWLYTIHSRNPQLIRLLEENQIKPHINIYKESIKCHYNEITDYFKENYYQDYPLDWFDDSYPSLKYHNYFYFPKILDQENACCIICYDYIYLFKLLLKNDKIDMKSNLILNCAASKYGNDEIVNILLKHDDIENIGQIFRESKFISEIEIPSTVKTIEYKSFNGCDLLEKIVFPSTITFFPDYVFENCFSLKSILLPFSIVSLGSSTFKNCFSLTEIDIPPTVKSFDLELFKGCKSLKKIIIPDSVTLFGLKVFEGCSSLTEILLPSSLASIPYGTFKDCSSLKCLTIPKSVKKIEDAAFYGCSSLDDLTILSNETNISEYAFDQSSKPKNIKIQS